MDIRRVVVPRGAGRIGGRRRHERVAIMDRLEIIELVSKNLNFRVGVSQFVFEALGLFLDVSLDHQLLLHEDLFLEGARIFGFGISK